jgi:hypothetical protein
MISRLGNAEFCCVYIYKLNQSNFIKKYIKYIIGDIDDFSYTTKMKHTIQNNAGFFLLPIKN